jgi:Na+-driven multidrug efflux pump
MVVNVVINPVLIKYAGLGVAGSAMASIIAMVIYSALTFWHFYSGSGELRINLKIKLNKELFRDILQTGLPSFYMQINGFFRQFVLFKLAAYNSTPAEISAFSGIYRLFSFAAIPVFGVLQAFGPVIGINFGAKQYARTADAIRVFRAGTILLMLCMALPCLLFSESVVGLLLTAPGLAAMAAPYFRMVIGVLLLMPLASTSIVFLQSTGQAKLAAKFTLRRELLIFTPVILMSVFTFGYAGIYYGLLLENIIYIGIVYWITRHQINALLHQPLQATI